MEPSSVKLLDFSEEAQANWSKRDAVLSKLSSGALEWKDLDKDDEMLLEKYGEVYEDIWDIVGGGCSWYCGGGPNKVLASSFLKSQGNNTYKPENAHDLNYKNAWIEGADGYGISEYLEYQFTGGAPRITLMKVVNGYVKSKEAWRNNSRVKQLKVYLNGIPFAILNLEDKIACQSFKFDPIGEKADWTLKFEIMDVYEGEKYDDVVISEIYFDGIDVH